MSIKLQLHKMNVKLSKDNTAQYYLTTNPETQEKIRINELLGKKVTIKFLGEINCVSCGRKTNKSFNQGYCFPCMRSLAACDMCILKPEQCHFDDGTCREPEWGLKHCFQPHYVYLSNTGNIKVGITRAENIPSRWIDQGASYALPIYRVDRRLTSGLVEITMKNHIADKTNWRTMLKEQPENKDLSSMRDELRLKTEGEIIQIQEKYGHDCLTYLPDEEIIEINFPVNEYPKKIVSFNLDKTPIAEGTLIGIKGQYLIFDTGCINIRKYGGYSSEIIF